MITHVLPRPSRSMAGSALFLGLALESIWRSSLFCEREENERLETRAEQEINSCRGSLYTVGIYSLHTHVEMSGLYDGGDKKETKIIHVRNLFLYLL